MKLIDSHCHMTDEAFDNDRSFIIKDLSNFGVDKIILPSVNLSSSKKVVDLSNTYENVFAQVGFHPENVDEFNKEDLKELEKLADRKSVV